jgi:hypothetical protein
MTICAYCKQDRTATREHIVPAFLYEYQKTLDASIVGWNEAAGKMVPGEFKVKDVCDDCNSRTLSQLDDYAKALLKNVGILTPNYTRSTLTLSYDYDLLVRWLLKVSFNSSRTDGAHRHLFEDLVPYMLGNEARPRRGRVTVAAYLAGAERIDSAKRAAVPYLKDVDTEQPFNPFLVRICYGAVERGRPYMLRLNVFGPLVFFMLLFDEGILPGHASAEIRRFLKKFAGAVELTAQHKRVELRAGETTWADLYAAQVARVKALNLS